MNEIMELGLDGIWFTINTNLYVGISKAEVKIEIVKLERTRLKTAIKFDPR